jgi:Tol biopolymer transport system component
MRTSKTLVITVFVALLTAATALATFPGQNGKIVFVGNQSGTWQIYTMDPDGSHMLQITSLPPTNLESWLPVFSPDGRRILFTHDTENNGALDLYTINADGTGLNQLTHDGLSSGGVWSPDGQLILFARKSPDTFVNVVTVMQADGSGEKKALTSEFWDSAPGVYTPDGQQIVFYTQDGGLVAAAWIMDTDGNHKRRLTEASLEGFPNDVSPDGQRILLTNHSNTDLENALFAIDINGRDLTQLTEAGYAPAGSYSPDGKKIVFVSKRLTSDDSLDIFAANSDGSDIQRIASDVTVGGCPDTNCVGPSWGPKPSK